MGIKKYSNGSWIEAGLKKWGKSKNSNNSWVDVPTYTRTDGTWVRDSDTWCYGFKVLKTSDDPDLKVEYLEDALGMTPASMGSTSFNYGSWSNAPFMPKACMLNFDGTVAYYLDDEDYSKKVDGTPSDVSNFDFNGNAMVEYGLLWYKFSDGDENTEFEFRVSNKKLDDDFVCHCNTDSHNDIIDHFYVPIYNGTTAPTYDSTTTYDVGAHVVYDGKEYRCITAVLTAEAFDSSKWDLVSNTPRMRSLSGVQLTPANGNGLTSGTEEIARAEACNVGADKEWFIDTLCDHELITMLHVLVAKSLDCQAKFGQGISSGSQTAKESYVTGSLDDKGSFYGSTSATTIAVKTFCRENFWALVWRRLAGLVGSSGNFLYKLTPNTADCSTATSYNTNGSGYLNGGVRPATGYVKNLKRATETILPDTTSSSDVGTKDYYYDGNGYALVGGASNSGAVGGPFVFFLGYAVSYRGWAVYGSPSCKPCKNKTET